MRLFARTCLYPAKALALNGLYVNPDNAPANYLAPRNSRPSYRPTPRCRITSASMNTSPDQILRSQRSTARQRCSCATTCPPITFRENSLMRSFAS